MKQASIYRAADWMGFCSSNINRNDQLGPTIRTAGNLLAVACLIFGAVFAVYLPASLDQRIGSLAFFGLIPAAGSYVAGHILSLLLVAGRKMCRMIATRCFRYLACLLKRLLVWFGRHAPGVRIGYLIPLAHCRLSKACRSICHRAWWTHMAFIEHLCARWVTVVRRGAWVHRPPIRTAMLLAAFGLGWCSWLLLDFKREDPADGAAIDSIAERIIGIEFDDLAMDAVVDRIIRIESGGDPNATNKRSSALGLGQFLDETWLDLLRAHRPDLVRGRSKDEMLELRRDAGLTREITMRFTQQNAAMLRKRGLPVTPGTLYLAHFAGSAGAVAILSSLEDADAASVMADADATGRTKREKIIKANSFLERFTVADLRSWADRKMRLPGP